jgi:hypothetical protein
LVVLFVRGIVLMYSSCVWMNPTGWTYFTMQNKLRRFGCIFVDVCNCTACFCIARGKQTRFFSFFAIPSRKASFSYRAKLRTKHVSVEFFAAQYNSCKMRHLEGQTRQTGSIEG